MQKDVAWAAVAVPAGAVPAGAGVPARAEAVAAVFVRAPADSASARPAAIRSRIGKESPALRKSVRNAER